MKKYNILLFLIVLSATSVFAGEGVPPSKVVVTPVKKELVAENKPFIGFIYYQQTSRLSTEVSGLVEKVEVREGDHVKKDHPLVRLNTEILDKEIELNSILVEQNTLRLNQSEKQYKRLKKLYGEKGVSEREYEDALYSYQDHLMEKQTAEKALQKLLLEKRKSIITAPYDCVIMEKNVDSGDWVQQGKQLLRIGSTSELHVKVPVAETLLQYTTIGDKVPVTINAYNQELTGTMEDFDPIADKKTKNIFLIIQIPYQDKVAENMSVTVSIPTAKPKELSIIPRDALIQFQGKDFVYTVKDNKASILPINIVAYLGDSVGADNPYFVVGMPVVVEGNERLRPDQDVVVAGEK
ncbi:MAG: efflux RND transporter periplasmic adaptor subunit [Desulfobulbaceae bacterium]|nr:efflux RND transporter periplasmic adaptor subunit [Desulfobulbaceae bacterium]